MIVSCLVFPTAATPSPKKHELSRAKVQVLCSSALKTAHLGFSSAPNITWWGQDRQVSEPEAQFSLLETGGPNISLAAVWCRENERTESQCVQWLLILFCFFPPVHLL